MQQQQQQQPRIEHSEFSPSFNCYSSDSLTSTAVAKVILEEQQGQEQDFEFSLMLNHDQVSAKEIGWPVFDSDLMVNNDFKAKDDVLSSITSPLQNLFIDEQQEESSPSSSSFSSSEEAGELDNLPSGTFCVWRPKCKKSRSTGGSGSKKWMGIRYLLRRSNSDPIVLLTPKQKQNSSERRVRAQTPVHEQFYVQRRAENEHLKRKTYLPYKQHLFGLFVSSNGLGKMRNFV